MMNGLALSLILTTMVLAGMFSPSPEKRNNQKDEIIVKEGHRTVVVEFENDDKSNTIVSISPQQDHVQEKWSTSPRELVCDAYGKCKHKLASALGKTKEKIYQVEEEVKEDVQEAYDKVIDKAHEAKEKVKHGASEVSDMAHEAKEKVKDGVCEVCGRAKEEVKEKAEVLKDRGKTLKEDVEKNVSKQIDRTKKTMVEMERKAEEVFEEAKYEPNRLKEEGKNELKWIFRRGREVVFDSFSYAFSPESIATSLRSLQLLGFSVAFGTSIWVTFISSYVLARALPRQQFAMVQSKVYPAYFRAMAYSTAAVFVGHLWNHREKLSSGTAETFQAFNLLIGINMILTNLFIMEPLATRVMFQRMRMEKEEVHEGKESETVEPSNRIIDSLTAPFISRAATAAPPGPRTSSTMAIPEAAAGGGEAAVGDEASRVELERLSRKLKVMNAMSSFLNLSSLLGLTWHLVYLGQSLR